MQGRTQGGGWDFALVAPPVGMEKKSYGDKYWGKSDKRPHSKLNYKKESKNSPSS